MNYFPKIGLEIHAELKTRTKMFCSCLNNPDEKQPNMNVCPICLGHPGTLPVINKKAVESVIVLGAALGGRISADSHFDRKSYFYPDLPKGYQISQYEHPLIDGGTLKNARIRRIHLEEDTGRLLHEKGVSLVDFNRAGVPLMELVTEPDIKSAEEAVAFAKELQLILRYLDTSNADMEKGQMRVEVNISLQDPGWKYVEGFGLKSGMWLFSGKSEEKTPPLNARVEIKNINSFRAVFGAINYEIKRQEEVLESGGAVVQETRGWDDVHKKTISQRLKEESQDYRYFPEPDLPPLDLREWDLEKIKTELPELPEAKRKRFTEEFNLSLEQADTLINDKPSADYFESAISELKTHKLPTANRRILFNYFTSDLKGLMSKSGVAFGDLKISPEHFAHFIALIQNKELTSRLAKNILGKMFETGEDPETIMNTEKLTKISGTDELGKIISEVIKENPSAVSDYRKGKTASLQFLIGKAMAKLKGRGEPNVLRELFVENL